MPFIENHAHTLRRLFFWVTPFYALAAALRNRFFDKGWKKSEAFPFPVICVGNLCAGGSGKTPMTEYFVRLLCEEGAVGIVSRGYGRKTRETFIAEAGMNAEQIGDEPVQYMETFSGKCPRGFALCLAAKRGEGIRLLKARFPEMRVCVLDDAFQHRSVRAGLNVLLSDFSHPFFRDRVLPCGTLRESRRESRRAQIIVFSKCPPDLTPARRDEFLKDCPLLPAQKVFFTTLRYGEFVFTARDSNVPETSKILLFTGIADPSPMEAYLRSRGYEILAHRRFGDHHNYTEKEMRDLHALYKTLTRKYGEILLLTTQKDYCRIKDTPAFAYFCDMPSAYLPVRIEFLFDGQAAFDKNIRKTTQDYGQI